MDIDKISREDILKKIETLKPLNKGAYDSAMTHMMNILNNFIKSNGFENICELKNCIDVTRFEISIKKENGYSYDVDVNFEKDWHRENEDKRMLTLNFCSFGSFYSSEMSKKDYLIVLGKLCEKMNELESQMLDFDWDEYDEIRDKFHNANYELTCYDQEVKNREFNNLKKDITEKLIVGTSIIIGTKRNWKNDKCEIIDDVRKLERIGNKTIDISGVYHRMKKDEVIHKLATKIWKFA